MRLLATGTAGFIGYHVAGRLLTRGDEVVGLDVIDDYYDVTLEEARLARLARHPGYRHERVDLAEGVTRVSDRPATPNPDWDGDAPDPASSHAPWRLYNIGNHTPVELMHLIELLERALGRDAIKNYLPMQPGDVPATYADITDLTRDVGFTPSTAIEEGVRHFVAWTGGSPACDRQPAGARREPRRHRPGC